MTENVIEAAIRIADSRRRQGVTSATIERLVIVAESDLPQEQRRQMIAEWRRARLL
jgi:hypothetical protein